MLTAAEAASAEQNGSQSRTERALSVSDHPASAVVLSSKGELLALCGHKGGRPAQQALRPGSTVKPILALIAARAGVTPRERYVCDGRFAPVSGLTCFDKHGELDLVHAIEQSCNAYFYDIAHRLGLESIWMGFGEFGLGKPTGLAQAESSGQLPGPEVIRAHQPDPNSKELWPAFTPIIGTGHGPIQVTLLQLTRAYARLAEELRADSEEPGAIEHQLLQGLRQVVQSAHGTGQAANVDGLDVAGKTGTAEPGSFDEEASEQGPHNGWFVGFAPAAEPQWIVGVVVLGGGQGGKTAAPLAKTIFEALRETG